MALLFALLSFVIAINGLCTIDCTTCSKCSAVGQLNSTHNLVTVDTSSCKDGSISWICCRSGGCSLWNGCPKGAKRTGNTCEESSGAITYVIPKAASSITVQLHDGQFKGGNMICTGSGSNGNCCGGSQGGSSCGSNVCQTVISLSSCGGVPVPPPAGSGSGDLPPAPVPVQPPAGSESGDDIPPTIVPVQPPAGSGSGDLPLAPVPVKPPAGSGSGATYTFETAAANADATATESGSQPTSTTTTINTNSDSNPSTVALAVVSSVCVLLAILVVVLVLKITLRPKSEIV